MRWTDQYQGFRTGPIVNTELHAWRTLSHLPVTCLKISMASHRTWETNQPTQTDRQTDRQTNKQSLNQPTYTDRQTVVNNNMLTRRTQTNKQTNKQTYTHTHTHTHSYWLIHLHFPDILQTRLGWTPQSILLERTRADFSTSNAVHVSK